MKSIVAIVGRPNAGKSTFFNRVTRSRDALVGDMPGVTRDRIYGTAAWDGVTFDLVDTGGFCDDRTNAFSNQIRFQVLQAIDHADVIVHLLDGKNGVSPYDEDMVHILRQLAKPVFFVVNKIDGLEQEEKLYDFYVLGIEHFYPISAEHRYGLNDFLDALVATLDKSEEVAPKDAIRLAVVGRPNVGKSSLVNKALGEDRLIVSAIPGTTRDAVDTLCTINGRDYLLIDTAGIRRKGKVKRKLEKFSVVKALKSLNRCDVALIVLDAKEGITDQDITIAGYAYEQGCGCILLLNKWDLVENRAQMDKHLREQVRMAAKFLSFAPLLTISARTGLRVTKIFKSVEEVYRQYTARIGTGKVNRIIAQATLRRTPSLHQGRRLKFYYTTQVSTAPPTFVSFVNYPEAVHFSYRRYLINRIREATQLDQTPIRLMLRPRNAKIDGRR